MSIAEVKNLTYSYNGAVNVLEDITFNINKGDFTGVLGPNGSGKTTLIKILLGLIKAEKGAVKLFGSDINSFKGWKNIGYLEQKNTQRSIIPLTAFEVARLGLLGGKKTPKVFTKNDNELTLEEMNRTGCHDYRNKLFYELSGGQQQRVLLARTLINKPGLLILDEPSTALDSKSRDSFFNLLSSLNKNQKITILLITHDIAEIGKYINKFLILDKRLIFHGDKADFCVSPEIIKYFGPYTPHLMDHLHSDGCCPLGEHQ